MPKTALLSFSAIIVLLGLTTACTKTTTHPSPVVKAGVSQTITLPADTGTLNGTATDPGGKIKTYLWEQISGPSASTIVDPGSLYTAVQNLVQGTYIFQLSAFDSLGGVGTDTTSIVVNPSPIKTLTLQPSNNPTEYTVAELNGTNETGPTIQSIDMDAWTISSQPIIIRCLLKFDLSAIPSTAKITSAQLYLYSDSTPVTGNGVDANYGADNSFTIQQVAANWSGATLTWSNQPAGLTANQVVVPSTPLNFLDLAVDVTPMVANMVNNNANYGFLMKLQNEVIYTSRIFIGSYNATNPNKHPKLMVTYQ